MTLFQAILSGIIQGVTEFFPISSSGHLVILHKLMGLEKPQMFFDIFLHIGTLGAIFIVFGKDIIDVLTIKKRIGFFILIGTLTTAIFVIIFGRKIEPFFSNTNIVGSMLIVTGAWLILGSFIRFGTEGLSGVKAALIGLVQGIAAIPGISRSGATIVTGLFLGLDTQSAAKFSFLLAIPAIIGALLFKMKQSSLSEFNVNYLVGGIASCIVGVLSLRLLLKILYRDKLHMFGIYCILIGILVCFLI